MNNELPKGWGGPSDPDCFQHYYEVFDDCYRYIEIREEPDVNGNTIYVVCTAAINLDDYSDEEIQQYVSGYYDSVEELIKEYGFEAAPMIEIECIFEQLPDYEMDNIRDRSFLTYEEAVERAKEFMQAYSDILE